MALKMVRGWLTQIGVLTSRPVAFAVFVLYAVAWLVFGDGLRWHSLAVMATWGMTLVIQRAEHRDTQAIHAKLDELLKATGDADDKVMDIDEKDAEDVENERKNVKSDAA
ncbi:MAG TPA: low affinity iron permease family protein [Bradyrhizobium sp.]|jgi:low affinity Fe/Cu permease|nr:low affinity iron permease family protein [Bradyrhizobium sp.]